MNSHNKCDRCFISVRMSVMSMFNEDIICMPCRDKEAAHPKYQEAVEAEAVMVRNGIMNFKGIGKPADL
jgi:hypothetical protein